MYESTMLLLNTVKPVESEEEFCELNLNKRLEL